MLPARSTQSLQPQGISGGINPCECLTVFVQV
jgi:hypothetical protein